MLKPEQRAIVEFLVNPFTPAVQQKRVTPMHWFLTPTLRTVTPTQWSQFSSPH